MKIMQVGARGITEIPGMGSANIDPEGSPVRAPQPQLAEPSGDVASPEETMAALRQLGRDLVAAAATQDPVTLMLAMAMQMRRLQTDSLEVDISANEQKRQDRMSALMDAMHRAQQAQEGAGFWNTIARVGSYIAAGAAIAVGIVGAVATGPVGVAASIALSASITAGAGSIGIMALQDTGVIPPNSREAAIAMALIAMVGAVGSLGAATGNALAIAGAITSASAQAANATCDLVAAAGGGSVGTEWRLLFAAVGFIGAGVGIAGAFSSAAGSTASAAEAGSRAAGSAAEAGSRAAGSAAQAGAAAGRGSAAAAQAGAAAGRGSAAAAQATSESARAIRTAARTVEAGATAIQGGAQVTQGVAGIGRAAYTAEADHARADAHERRGQLARLAAQLDDLVDALRDAMKAHRRATQRVFDAGLAQGQARLALIRNV